LKGALGFFCTSLHDFQYTNDSTATTSDFKDGIVHLYGLNRSVKIYENVIHDIQQAEAAYLNSTNTSKRSNRPGLGERADNSLGSTRDMTAWTWQTCTETGMSRLNILNYTI
jgi:hypothetical protein